MPQVKNCIWPDVGLWSPTDTRSPRRPSLFQVRRKVKEVVAGLDAAGAAIPDGLDGKSWLPLVKDEEVKGEKIAWRNELLYEYYWKQSFLQTPTLHALLGDKFIRYQGIWDIDEL